MYAVMYFHNVNEYYKIWKWTVFFNDELVAEGWSDTFYAAQYAANWKIAVHQAANVIRA